MRKHETNRVLLTVLIATSITFCNYFILHCCTGMVLDATESVAMEHTAVESDNQATDGRRKAWRIDMSEFRRRYLTLGDLVTSVRLAAARKTLVQAMWAGCSSALQPRPSLLLQGTPLEAFHGGINIRVQDSTMSELTSKCSGCFGTFSLLRLQ
jgi:hypothetical protein